MTKKKSNSKLLKEAIVDADALKELAIENAKEYLSEVFSPHIKSVLKAKLQREDELPDEDETEDKVESDEEKEDETPVKEDEVPVTDKDEDEDEDEEEEGDEVTEQEEPEPDKDEDEEDIDLEQVLNDLDSDEDEDEDKDEDEPVGGDEEPEPVDDDEEIDVDIEDDEDEPVGGDKEPEPVDDDEEIDVDIEDDEDDEDETVEEDEEPVELPDEDEDEVEKLSTEIRRLRKENWAYRKTLHKLTQRLNEVNLLNAKLHYAQKLTKHPRITDKQKATVISALDRAKNIREVKLTFANLVEAFEVQNEKSKKLSRINEILDGGASSRKAGRPNHTIISDAAIQRIQKLAGIKKQ